MSDRIEADYLSETPIDPALAAEAMAGEQSSGTFVCALIQGPEEHYALCEEIAKVIYPPVSRAHRCTLENIAVLEPALSETVAATFCLALRDAADRAVSMGVLQAAAHDFVLGHMKIELANAFGIFPEGKFSDGTLMAIDKAKSVIFKESWLDDVFSLDAVKQSVRDSV